MAVGIGGGDELVKAPADDRLLTTMLVAEVLLGSLLGSLLGLLLDCVLLVPPAVPDGLLLSAT